MCMCMVFVESRDSFLLQFAAPDELLIPFSWLVFICPRPSTLTHSPKTRHGSKTLLELLNYFYILHLFFHFPSLIRFSSFSLIFVSHLAENKNGIHSLTTSLPLSQCRCRGWGWKWNQLHCRGWGLVYFFFSTLIIRRAKKKTKNETTRRRKWKKIQSENAKLLGESKKKVENYVL